MIFAHFNLRFQSVYSFFAVDAIIFFMDFYFFVRKMAV